MDFLQLYRALHVSHLIVHSGVEISRFPCHDFLQKFREINCFTKRSLLWFDLTEKFYVWQWISRFSTLFCEIADIYILSHFFGKISWNQHMHMLLKS